MGGLVAQGERVPDNGMLTGRISERRITFGAVY
jgi:hypothetical protein